MQRGSSVFVDESARSPPVPTVMPAPGRPLRPAVAPTTLAGRDWRPPVPPLAPPARVTQIARWRAIPAILFAVAQAAAL